MGIHHILMITENFFEIEAEDSQDAIRIAKKMYEDGEISPTHPDFFVGDNGLDEETT